jgi:enoyl reductase-like protein
MLRTLPLVRHSIELEIKALKNPEYWGTIENIENENEIFKFVLLYDIVNQDWFDERLKYTNTEILSELETKLKEIDEFYEVHELSEEQLNDEEYIESLYNNYKENK